MALARGFRRRQTQRANELLYLAWHTELFARYERLPRLEEILRDPDDEPRAKRAQTPEEMLAMCRMLNAALGGEEREA